MSKGKLSANFGIFMLKHYSTWSKIPKTFRISQFRVTFQKLLGFLLFYQGRVKFNIVILLLVPRFSLLFIKFGNHFSTAKKWLKVIRISFLL